MSVKRKILFDTKYAKPGRARERLNVGWPELRISSILKIAEKRKNKRNVDLFREMSTLVPPLQTLTHSYVTTNGAYNV